MQMHADTAEAIATPAWLRASLRWFAVSVLLVASPGVQDLGRDVLTASSERECEDDGCGPDGDCCPPTCVHCTCCAHLTAAPTQAQSLPGRQPSSSFAFGWYTGDAYSSGYRAPHFRPPAG